MVEAAQQFDEAVMAEKVDSLKEECEVIMSIYEGEGVIKSEPEYKVVPKFTLLEVAKAI